MTVMDRLLAIGPADYRPCGCINDPLVFGPSCTSPQCTGRTLWPR